MVLVAVDEWPVPICLCVDMVLPLPRFGSPTHTCPHTHTLTHSLTSHASQQMMGPWRSRNRHVGTCRVAGLQFLDASACLHCFTIYACKYMYMNVRSFMAQLPQRVRQPQNPPPIRQSVTASRVRLPLQACLAALYSKRSFVYTFYYVCCAKFIHLSCLSIQLYSSCLIFIQAVPTGTPHRMAHSHSPTHDAHHV